MQREELHCARTVEELDMRLVDFAEALWSEGDMRSLFANCISGMQHYVPSLRGRLNASWRIFGAWKRSEPAKQAHPLTVAMTHGIAGWFRLKGHFEASVGILLAHHAILRTGELFELRKGDIKFSGKTAHLILRDTKVGQRYGVRQ